MQTARKKTTAAVAKKKQTTNRKKWLLLIPIVVAVCAISWFAIDQYNQNKTAKNAAAIAVTQSLESAQPTSTADPGLVPVATTDTPDPAPAPQPITYKSSYEGLHFTYPADWRFTDIDSDSKDSDGIVLTSPDNGVLVTFGLPVSETVRAIKCDEGQPGLTITNVKKFANIGSKKPLYLVRYTWGQHKATALTDWDGQTPIIGATDTCSFPTMQASRGGEYLWMRISDTSDGYSELPDEQFYNHPYVQAAEAILESTSYK